MDTIQTLIDNILALKDKNHISSQKWKPSNFGGCFRKQYWSRKGEIPSNPIDIRTKRVFAAGQLFHDFVQNLLRDYQKEVVVNTQPDVLGFADLVGENEVIDIKSQHSKSFWYMSKFKGDDIKKEKYSNWLQVGFYARELKKKWLKLIYISKDDLCIQEYVQPLDEYWLGKIEAELSALREIWSKQELPPAKPRCEPRKDGTFWECDFCPFSDLCKKIEKK